MYSLESRHSKPSLKLHFSSLGSRLLKNNSHKKVDKKKIYDVLKKA